MNDFEYIVPAPVGVKVLGWSICLLCVFFIVLVLIVERADSAVWVPVIGLAFGGGTGVFVAMSHIYMKSKDGTIKYGLWPLLSRVVAFHDIRLVDEVADVSPVSFGGIGYRRVPGNKLGLLWSRGPAVAIHTNDGGSVTMVTENATELAEDLRRHIVGRG